MAEIVLIRPNEARATYGGLADELTAIEPPIWIRIIAGYLRAKGFTVQIIDMDALRAPPRQLPKLILGTPRLAAIVCYGNQPSASTQTMSGVPALTVWLNTLAIPSIIVGGHASALPEQTLRECASTYVCDGEGPITIEALMNQCELEFVPGLVYRPTPEFNNIKRNPPARLLYADTTEVEGDAWDLLDMSKYRAHPWQCFGDLSARQPYASIYSSFGCSYKCEFCCINAPFHSNLYRTRNPASVVKEIVKLHDKYGVKTIKIADELFVLKPRHYEAVCQGIVDAGLENKLNIWAYARTDTIRESSLDLLRRAGVRWLALGIEAASEKVRGEANKALRDNDIEGTVRKIQASGINVIGNMIFGLPGDTLETMEQTYRMSEELDCDFVNYYVSMPYPGSRLYTDAVASGRELPGTWSGYSQHSYDCFPVANESLTSAQILQFRDEAFSRFYSSPRYLSHVSNKFGPDARAYVEKMAAHPLPRKLLEKPE